MVHPVYITILRRPGLLADHTRNYIALLRESAADAVRGVLVKAVAWAIAVVFFFLGLGLAGIALMLNGLHHHFHWAFIALPGVAFLVTALAVAMALRPVIRKEVHDISAELEMDKKAIVLTSSRSGGDL